MTGNKVTACILNDKFDTVAEIEISSKDFEQGIGSAWVMVPRVYVYLSEGEQFMLIGILKKGDRVISVTTDFIAVERKNKEVDIVPLSKDDGALRVDIENIATIGYGDNIVQATDGDVTVTTF